MVILALVSFIANKSEASGISCRICDRIGKKSYRLHSEVLQESKLGAVERGSQKNLVVSKRIPIARMYLNLSAFLIPLYP